MNALQTEFLLLRETGMSAREALASMIEWRRRATISLVLSGRFIPPFVTTLVSELTAEIERLRMTRRMVGVRT